MKRRSFLASLVAAIAAPFLPTGETAAEAGETAVDVGRDTESLGQSALSDLTKAIWRLQIAIEDIKLRTAYRLCSCEYTTLMLVRSMQKDWWQDGLFVSDLVYPGLASCIDKGGLPDEVD